MNNLAGLIGGLAPNERKALDQIVETADLLTVGGRQWLLVPAPPSLLDRLATLGAEFAECEWTLDNEEEQDDDQLITFGKLDDGDKEAEHASTPTELGHGRRKS